MGLESEFKLSVLAVIHMARGFVPSFALLYLW